ncbi:MAG: hypothetical protein U0V03_02175 [Bacteroidia bacterium]
MCKIISIKAQSFTEIAFNENKAIVDTSEIFEKIESSKSTFDRLLLGTPNDSLLNYYCVFSETKMAYLVLEKDPQSALNYIANTRSKFIYIDTTFKFDKELELLLLLQNIITLKAEKNNFITQQILEKKCEQFYLQNKNNPRASLIYAYCQNTFNKPKQALTLINITIEKFKLEKHNAQKIAWGIAFAKNIKKKILKTKT